MIRRPPRSTPLSLHDALPIFHRAASGFCHKRTVVMAIQTRRNLTTGIIDGNTLAGAAAIHSSGQQAFAAEHFMPAGRLAVRGIGQPGPFREFCTVRAYSAGLPITGETATRGPGKGPVKNCWRVFARASSGLPVAIRFLSTGSVKTAHSQLAITSPHTGERRGGT